MKLNKPDYLLTFEWDADKEVLEIHANQQGLEKLKNLVGSLLVTSNCDHIHLMTNEWGGEELSDERQSLENELINHVKIFKWEE